MNRFDLVYEILSNIPFMSSTKTEDATSVESVALGDTRVSHGKMDQQAGNLDKTKSSNLNQSGATTSANGSAQAGGSGLQPKGQGRGSRWRQASKSDVVDVTTPKASQSKRGAKHEITCFNCKQVGHKANACKQPRLDAKQKVKTRGAPFKKGRGGGGDEVFDTHQHIKSAKEQYTATTLYTKAIKLGFYDQQSLDSFNDWVRRNVDKIDPREMVFCDNCGQVLENLELCNCFIKPADADPKDESTVAPVAQLDPTGALMIPSARANIHRSFFWVNGVRQYFVSKFAWPTFNWTRISQPNIGGFRNSDLGDDDIIPSLYTYLTVKRKADYMFNGKDDRRARVSHFKTLSSHWLDENNIKTKDISHEMALRILHTVQRAADGVETNMLLDYNNPVKNTFWANFRPARVVEFIAQNKRLAVMLTPVLVMSLSPGLRTRLYRALLRPTLGYLRRHLSVSVELLLHGSWLTLTSLTTLVRDLAQVLMSATSSGRDSLRQSSLQLSSMATVAITSMNRSISDIYGTFQSAPLAQRIITATSSTTQLLRSAYLATMSRSLNSSILPDLNAFSETPLNTSVDPDELAAAITAASVMRDTFYREELDWARAQSTQ